MEYLTKHVRLVPHDSVAWFDLLDRLGVWRRWLGSAKSDEVDYAVWLLSLRDVMLHRSAQVASLAQRYRDNTQAWSQRLETLFASGSYFSREMFDLLLSSIADGSLDHVRRFSWSSLHSMPDEKPDWAAELIAHVVAHLFECALKDGKTNPFEAKMEFPQMLPDFLTRTAEKAPEAFVHFLLPWVVYLVHWTAETHEGETIDRIWPFTHLGRDHDMKDALLSSLVKAMVKLAREKPDALDYWTSGLLELPHATIAFLLESAWAENAQRYADLAAEYLLVNANRFTIGYFFAGSGGHAAITRKLLKTITPYCSQAAYAKLETAIIGYCTSIERQHPKSIGVTELHLLEGLSERRLSEKARLRLGELQRKFPGLEPQDPQPIRMIRVKSPIARAAIEKMNDEEWLSAMAEYTEDRIGSQKEFGKGGLHQLAMELEREAKKNKPRFAALVSKMSDAVRSRYFSTILSAIVSEMDPKGVVTSHQVLDEGPPIVPGPPLETEKIMAVIDRLHILPEKPCGAAICRAVAHIAERDLPESVYAIVSYYAINDPDPDKELWQIPALGSTAYFAGDAVLNGINTVRGAAAGGIAALLFADPKRSEKLKAAVNALIEDPSLAVRACAVEALIALLNCDRDKAVVWFLRLCETAEPILGTQWIDNFLYYAVITHYSTLRPLLQKMLGGSAPESRKVAARQICLASLSDPEAAKDAEAIDEAGELPRTAAAEIYAANLCQPTLSTLCRAQLRRYFNDESPNVRAAAAMCFRQISDAQLQQETELIGAFLESLAFEEGMTELLFALEDSKMLLPEIICRIPERLIEKYRASQNSGAIDAIHWTHMMPALVLRLYEQTGDAATKTRCLNVIDAMIELDFGSIQTELMKVER